MEKAAGIPQVVLGLVGLPQVVLGLVGLPQVVAALLEVIVAAWNKKSVWVHCSSYLKFEYYQFSSEIFNKQRM